MVFDMDSEVKAAIDKRSSHEHDFRKLGFQVLNSLPLCLHCSGLMLDVPGTVESHISLAEGCTDGFMLLLYCISCFS